MAHPLDDIAEWLRSAPLGFVGFSVERINLALDAIDDVKRADAFRVELTTAIDAMRRKT